MPGSADGNGGEVPAASRRFATRRRAPARACVPQLVEREGSAPFERFRLVLATAARSSSSRNCSISGPYGRIMAAPPLDDEYLGAKIHTKAS
jgi:hypothetical protein